jgi:phosphatidylserine decarboxylase
MAIKTILRSMRLTMDRDGWLFVVPMAALSVAAFVVFGPGWAFWCGLAGTVALVHFFRDPDRVPPEGGHFVVSAADGVFVSIAPAAPPPELEMGDTACLRVSVFLNLTDVHVTRVPSTGHVRALSYRPGRRMSTALDKSSDDNERMAVRIDSSNGTSIAVCQIAGPVVRRIRCDLQIGDLVQLGDRYGLIRFGSRVDVYLPIRIVPMVRVGQRSVAGETVIADLSR